METPTLDYRPPSPPSDAPASVAAAWLCAALGLALPMLAFVPGRFDTAFTAAAIHQVPAAIFMVRLRLSCHRGDVFHGGRWTAAARVYGTLAFPAAAVLSVLMAAVQVVGEHVDESRVGPLVAVAITLTAAWMSATCVLTFLLARQHFAVPARPARALSMMIAAAYLPFAAGEWLLW